MFEVQRMVEKYLKLVYKSSEYTERPLERIRSIQCNPNYSLMLFDYPPLLLNNQIPQKLMIT